MSSNSTRKRRLSALIALGILLTVVPGAHARSLVMCSVNWAPYYGEDLPRQGFFTDLTRAAFRAVDYDVDMQFMPWARAMLEVEQGDRDILLGAYYTDERAETYLYSDEIYSTRVGLVARKDLGIREFDSLRDLTEYEIGYGRGWATTDEFDNADYLNKQAADSNVLNVRKLYKGRIDMIAMGFDRFQSIAKEEGLDPDEVVFLEPVLKESGLFILASPELDEREQVIADFNAGLRTIRENGTYDQILRDMGFDQ